MKNTLTALAAVVATMAGMAGTTTALARACIRRRTVSPERRHPVHRHTAGDGTFSFSQHRGGTCSRHGRVGQWL